MIKPLITPIGNGSIREKRGKSPFTGVEQRKVPLDIQIDFLLACKAGIGQIFRRGAAPDSHVHRFRVNVT